MAEILVFPQPAREGRRGDDVSDGTLATRLRSSMDGVARTLVDLLIALLDDLEDSSVRLSLVIERTVAEADKVALRAEQQDIRATIAQLKQAIGDEAHVQRARRSVVASVGRQLSARPPST